MWLMLDGIANITNVVAAGLNARIKAFGQKGLSGLYLRRENAKRIVLDMSSIAGAINQLGVLPDNAVTNLIQGLLLAFHLKFSKMFADYASNFKNPLMKGVKLEDNTAFEMISTVLSSALETYASYLSTGDNAWMQMSSRHVNIASTTPAGFKYDNCLGSHWMSDFPKEFDNDCIAANRKARGAPPSRNTGGRGKGRGCGRDGGCDG